MNARSRSRRQPRERTADPVGQRESLLQLQTSLWDFLAASRHLTWRAKKAGDVVIPPDRLQALQVLYADGEATHKDLVEEAGLSSASVSAMVNQLEAQGLIRRRPDEHDGRVLKISLTEVGATELGQLQADWLRRFDAAFADLDDRDLEIVRDALDRVTRIVDSIAVK